MPAISETYGISELGAQRSPEQLDAPEFIHEVEGSKRAYNVDPLYRDFPAELGDGERAELGDGKRGI